LGLLWERLYFERYRRSSDALGRLLEFEFSSLKFGGRDRPCLDAGDSGFQFDYHWLLRRGGLLRLDRFLR
jgi:hypothetical protein